MGERQWTAEQASAIETRDRTLLVSSAAGSGKTATLTERIIRSILDEDNPVDINEMLIVTFTKAAVGELRDRISGAIKEKLKENPNNERLERQLRLLPSAKISTIDAFCSDILRNNCERVGVNPNYRIADNAEIVLLSNNIIDGLISAIYEGYLPEVATPLEIEKLGDCLTDNKSQDDMSALVSSLHGKLSERLEGVELYRRLVEEYNPKSFTAVENTKLGKYSMKRIKAFAEHYARIYRLHIAELEADGNPKAEKRLDFLRSEVKLFDMLMGAKTYDEVHALYNMKFETIPALSKELSHLPDTKTVRDIMKKDFSGIMSACFDFSSEVWRSVFGELYSTLMPLCRIVEEFDRRFTAEKLRRGICEFSDVTRYTYTCLWQNGERTDLAKAESESYKAIYVDEYQDVNEIQHRIFEAISTPTNRFMVGDIKQSIYAFRGADSTIFAEMKRTYSTLGTEGDFPYAKVLMSDNFRCDEGIVDYVNNIFDTVFGALSDSIGYERSDRLRFGKKYSHTPPPYRYPQLLLVESREKKLDDEDGTEATPIIVAEKIKQLVDTGIKNDGTPISPKDIAIIMRTKSKIPLYVDALKNMGIESTAQDNTNYLGSPECLLALSMLNAIDNPKRDIYLASLMCSPLFSFSADELTVISRSEGESLYDSLVSYSEKNPDYTRGVKFLEWLGRSRAYSEGVSVDVLLGRLYNETALLSLAARNGVKENLIKLYELSRSFEGSSFRGLYNFLAYVNCIMEKNINGQKNELQKDLNAVKIITAHTSKGLEYPIVFYVGAESTYENKTEREEKLQLDTDMGFGMYLRTPSGLSPVENPTRKIIWDYKKQKACEEEARVLYVALTRAKEQLYVVATLSKGVDKYVAEASIIHEGFSSYTAYNVNNHRDLICYAIGPRFVSVSDFLGRSYEETATEEENSCDTGSEEVEKDNEKADTVLSAEDTERASSMAQLLFERFNYKYPYEYRTRLPEKLSVSRLYPTVLDDTDDFEGKITGGEVKLKLEEGYLPAFATGKDERESAKRGIATHLLFQFADFENLRKNGASAELERLHSLKFISDKDKERVRLDEVEAFVRSGLFADICEAKELYRELRFNVRLPAASFTENEELKRSLSAETVLVQGVIDCLILDGEGEYHLVDYKTDRLTREERENRSLAEKKLREAHSEQLSYYAEAVKEMFGKYPVTVEVYSLHLGDTVDVKRKTE